MLPQNEVIDMYLNQNKTISDIARFFNISETPIDTILRKNHITKKDYVYRKYKVDETYFDEINTKDKAYFLGWMFADGYNNRKNQTFHLTIHSKDKNIQENLLSH